jgi:hypothetical protein
MRKFSATSLMLLLCLSAVVAAAMYPPPITALKANEDAVVYNSDPKYKLTRDADNKIDAIGEGDYNYDTAWTFSYFTAYTTWREGDGVDTNGAADIYTSEAGMASPGTWKYTHKLPDIATGTKVFLTATLKVVKPKRVAAPVDGEGPPAPPAEESVKATETRIRLAPARNN